MGRLQHRILAVWLAVSATVQAEPGFGQGSVSAGRQMAARCSTCHGMDGIARIPNAPNIAGEDASYLRQELEAFRSGERRSPQMEVVARNLSDQNIADLAAYYAAIEIQVTKVPR